MSQIIVPDISKWQGDIDWKKITTPVILRAGYRGEKTGIINTDETLLYNSNGVNKQQIEYGLYFYSQAISASERAEEANFLIEKSKLFSTKPLFLALDLEIAKGEPRNKINSKLTWREIRDTFTKTVRAAGYVPCIYRSESFWIQNLDCYSPDYRHWVANWTKEPKIPYTIWQYTNKGTFNGISKNVDLNYMEYVTEKKDYESLIDIIIDNLYTLKEALKK